MNCDCVLIFIDRFNKLIRIAVADNKQQEYYHGPSNLPMMSMLCDAHILSYKRFTSRNGHILSS